MNRITRIGLNFIAAGMFALLPALSRASVIQSTTSFDTIHQYGVGLIDDGLMAFRATTQSGTQHYGAAVTAELSDGSLRPIVPHPAYTTWAQFGGYSPMLHVGGQDIQPFGPVEGGQGYMQGPMSYMNQSAYADTGFLDGSGNPFNINGYPGDSGGGAFTLDGKLWGITSAGQLDHSNPLQFTVFSLLDDPQVLAWRDGILSRGGTWAFTAAHCVQDFADPVVLEDLAVTEDASSPSTIWMHVTDVEVYNHSRANAEVTDFSTQDLALVRYEAVPEPSSLAVIAF